MVKKERETARPRDAPTKRPAEPPTKRPRARLSIPTPYTEITNLLPAKAVPLLLVSYDDLVGMSLDERTGFLLSFIDGRATVGQILDVCCIERSEAVALFLNLIHRGAIALR